MATINQPDVQKNLDLLQDKATRLRIDSVRSTSAAGSGHPTSCASAAEIMSVLFFSVMRYDPKDPKNPANDVFVLSKGHAAPSCIPPGLRPGCFRASICSRCAGWTPISKAIPRRVCHLWT